MSNTQIPEDSVLRRHYLQMQEAARGGSTSSAQSGAGASARPTQAAAPSAKGFLQRLMDTLFGRS